ncbi:AAA family ATPase [Streptomyces sp. NBC_00878]|uniref:AAA family ATPase n=1 Tax=Streptomyces sp. NBC_00878 TaxID=2975854 RepID=UPI00224F8274|nr:LuxR family transcriptional regulator [Streptomyces sp. NBC_00878]MCX4903737.1 AAA family ATPase [Streptomyces sp. NBC_00878]
MQVAAPATSRGDATADSGRLYGRAREVALLDHLVADCRAGRGRTLLVHGERGIGKSALLDHVQTASRGVRVVRVNGVASEGELSFAAAQRLCAQFRENLPGLPVPQRETVESILGLRPGSPPARLDAGLALHGLLASAAWRHPVLCLLDDAHLMDAASRECLTVAARRCAGERLAFVFTLPATEHPGEFASFSGLAVTGLSDEDAQALLTERVHVPLDARIRERLVADAHGSPRALLSVASSLSPTEMAFVRPTEPVRQGPDAPDGQGAESPDGRGADSPDPGTLAGLADLSAPAREVLLVAAAEPLGDAVTVLETVESLRIEHSAVTEAESSGLVELSPRVRFAHPLVRTRLYAAAGVTQRRRVHRALAGACDPVRAPEQRAWHEGQAAASFDESVAARLQEAAERASGEHGSMTTAALWELSAALTADRPRRAVRLLAGAVARRRTGGLRQSLDLLARVHTSALPDAQRARADVLRARTRYDVYRDAASVRALRTTATQIRTRSAAEARAALLEALAAGLFAGRFCHPDELAEIAWTAHDLPPLQADARPHELLLEAATTHILKGFSSAVAPVRRAVDAYLTAPSATDLDSNGSWLVCQAAIGLWDSAAWETLADRRVAAARRHSVVSALPLGLVHQALVCVHGGRLTEARTRVREAEGICEAIGAAPLRHATLVLEAWTGHEERLEALVRAGRQDARAREEGRLLTVADYAQALLYNSLGRYGEAFEACTTSPNLDEPAFRNWLLPELVEAAVRTHHPEEAAAAATRLEECARLTESAWAQGLHLRAQALLADDSDAEDLYRGSAQKLEAAGAVLQAGRTRLLWGEWQRRTGRTTQARVHLQTAHDVFSRVGARAFAERSADELAAAGARPAPAHHGPQAALTAQEQRIVRRVARGDTSKEVAAALYLSPRTVDAHLRSIFRKLGISSRRQLRNSAIPPHDERL